MGWLPVYKREMRMLVRRIGGLGYLFSGLLFPIIYLLAFGWGLGESVQVAGGYIAFLAKGMLSITVMMNSFQQTVISISSARFYYRNFQTLRMSPVSEASLALGLTLAGMTRGVAAVLIIALAAWLFFGAAVLSLPGVAGLLLTSLCFGALGVAVGMSIKGQEQFSIVINFLITPMTFFCGSFFPVSNLPELVQSVVRYLPLSLSNQLLRLAGWDAGGLCSAAILLAMTAAIFMWSVHRIRNYSEF